MKTKLLSTLLALTVIAGIAKAEIYNGKCGDNLSWSLNTQDSTLTITGSGEMALWSSESNVPWYGYTSKIKYVSLPDGLTSIGKYAFRGCTRLTSVTIPNSVTSIGYCAFWDCSGLTSIDIPNSVFSIGSYAFAGCTGLKSIEIPNSVISIGNRAFSRCTGLTSVTIPNSVTSIGEEAFSGCSGSTSVVLNSNVILCKSYSESSNISNIFGTYVKNYVIGSSVTSIGDCAFYGCSGLTSVTIGNSVTSIGDMAFYNCTGLTSVTIGNSVTNIGDMAFYNCTRLTSVTIPNSVTSIGNYAFAYCSGLTSVTIPNSVTSIGSYAFSGCSNLTSVEIPNSVTSIEYGAFSGCNGLTSVTIPNSVTSIGGYAFYGCSGLKAIYCESSTPAIIATNTFPSAPIYVPQCAYTTYQNAPIWKDLTLSPVDVNLAVVNNTGGVVNETCGSMEIEAIPYIGYHFKRWQDGNKENPRKYTLTQSNRNFIAEFEIDKYTITLNCDANQGSITGDKGKFNYDTDHTIEAVPNYGYHFTQWSDGETDNPREFILEQDTTFTALFAPNKYSLAIQYDNSYGDVEGEEGEFDYLSEHTITVNAKYGYHLDAWSDGVTDNPRTLILTKDSTITAIFAPNKYSLELIADANLGEIEGEQGEFDYLSEHEIQAVPKTGCVFNGWSDGVTTNPRTIILTKDTSITALFEQYVHEVTVLCNNEQGSVAKSGETYHSAECTISATPNYGYHFTQWNDGVADNPRTFIVTQDTTFTAEFAVDRTGTCGTDLALTWTYDPEEKVLTISGTGAFNDNMQCGIEARTALTKIEFAEGVTAIGTSAFANCETLQTLVLRKDVKKINENAFYNCENLTTIYNYRSTPANVLSTAFDGVDKFECVLYVPQASLDLYKNASVWRDFYYTQALPETPTAIDEITDEQSPMTNKLLRNGQILILRGEKVYTIDGRLVR